MIETHLTVDFEAVSDRPEKGTFTTDDDIWKVEVRDSQGEYRSRLKDKLY